MLLPSHSLVAWLLKFDCFTSALMSLRDDYFMSAIESCKSRMSSYLNSVFLGPREIPRYMSPVKIQIVDLVVSQSTVYLGAVMHSSKYLPFKLSITTLNFTPISGKRFDSSFIGDTFPSIR